MPARILGKAMRVLQQRCVAGIKADEARCAGVARSQHRAGHGAEPVHRLRCDRGHRQGIGAQRQVDSRARPRTAADPRSRARRDPVGGRDDNAWRSGRARDERSAARNDDQTGTLAVALIAAAGLSPAAQHGRFFPPKDLVLLEGPDRDAWQRPDQIMDELRIADGSVVADLGRRWRVVHGPARPSCRTKRQGLRRGHPAADDRGHQAPGRARGADPDVST